MLDITYTHHSLPVSNMMMVCMNVLDHCLNQRKGNEMREMPKKNFTCMKQSERWPMAWRCCFREDGTGNAGFSGKNTAIDPGGLVCRRIPGNPQILPIDRL